LRAEQNSANGALRTKRADFATAKRNVLVLDLEVRLRKAQSKTKFCN
jgi:hypothetical protein